MYEGPTEYGFGSWHMPAVGDNHQFTYASGFQMHGTEKICLNHWGNRECRESGECEKVESVFVSVGELRVCDKGVRGCVDRM